MKKNSPIVSQTDLNNCRIKVKKVRQVPLYPQKLTAFYAVSFCLFAVYQIITTLMQ